MIKSCLTAFATVTVEDHTYRVPLVNQEDGLCVPDLHATLGIMRNQVCGFTKPVDAETIARGLGAKILDALIADTPGFARQNKWHKLYHPGPVS